MASGEASRSPAPSMPPPHPTPKAARSSSPTTPPSLIVAEGSLCSSPSPWTPSVRQRTAMAHSFKALAAAGVEGIVMEVWWGLFKRDRSQVYEWKGYWDITEMARWCGLKDRVFLGFHQCGSGPEDPHWSIGMGPGGELAYPLPPSQVLTTTSSEPVEFHCYDKGSRERFLRRRSLHVGNVGCLPLRHWLLQRRSQRNEMVIPLRSSILETKHIITSGVVMLYQSM